jgi:catechol 2,3-dioxygenase-like lactoylglutathione lyase family enzyme
LILRAARSFVLPDAGPSLVDAARGPPGSDDQLALKERSGAQAAGEGFHIALSAGSRSAVDAFHAVALVHGGADDGPPGLRPAYGPGYYAAFVRDPDRYRVEAVSHEPEGLSAPRPRLLGDVGLLDRG